MPNVYERLGVRPIINASGPSTRLSGAIMPPEVAEAMREATQYCVDIAELQARAGQIIAEITGAESGYVTSGAAAGLLLGTAACVTGLDPGRMNRLPDTTGMKNEVIIGRSQRNFYDHAVRSVGIKLVEVGIADRYSGAGVRDTEAWEIADAITPQTAAVFYVAYPHSLPSLKQVVEVAHAAGVPVLVDAAGQLPPASNLKRFIAEGADLVSFSGGKAIRGPQSSGILCGRRDLISAVALQHLDLDILWEQWNPPPSLIDKSRLPGAPQHGIGRPCKVGKEQIIGLITALRLFVAEDPEARRKRWLGLMEALVAAAQGLPHAEVTLSVDRRRPETPGVQLKLNEEAAGMTALDLVRRLQDGNPGIHAGPGRVSEGIVTFGPMCLKEGEPELIGKRLRELLK
ncbi:MAG: aminotransferase class V-fold PLP-dependent enzyme [Candidatus Latescibacteria bacterium]|nr:aminotransferase class V-fold PLP-dependent enzyme [Candidatus Latescibacterota bacterium]